MTKEVRQNLSYAYRILGKLGLADHTYTHLSARPDGADYYYIFPFGLRFEEVTPENLLKVSLNGKILEGREHQYNKTGYTIHASIYSARPDLNALYHLHTVSTVAVSAMKEGLLPMNQWALHFYDNLAYHEYNSQFHDKDSQGSCLVKDLGNKSVIFLRNHGYIACGKTPWEAIFYFHHLEHACRAQIASLSSGVELVTPSDAICRKANADLLSFEQDLGMRDWLAWIRWLDS
ncbi:MAG: class II aldolase/adducin family protein [Pseudomonadota bacterium]